MSIRLVITALALFLLAPELSLAALKDLPGKTTPAAIYHVPASYGVEGEVKLYEDEERAVSVCIIRLSGSTLRLGVRDMRKSGYKQGIYTDVAKASDLVVMSGGFFGYNKDGDLIPLGLVVDGGRLASRQIKWITGGMIIQGPDGIRIVRAVDYQAGNLISDAIQSKPMLVMGGLNDMPREGLKRSDRVGIGLSETGDLIIAGVFGADEGAGGGATLYELAEIMLKAGAQSALALDGGPSAHIYLPWLKKHLGYSGLYYIPNVIHIRTSK